MNSRTALALIVLALGSIPLAAQNGKPDAEGFIRDWLILAPFPIAETSGAEEIDNKQFADEAQPAAKEGATQKIGDTVLKWRKVTTPLFLIDFKELYPELNENVVAWAVAYIVCTEEKTGVTLRMNSNDQGKAFLNGKEAVKFTEARTLEKDTEDSAPYLTLKKGVNVLVLKVINEVNSWQGSVRFVDKVGKPITDLKIETKP